MRDEGCGGCNEQWRLPASPRAPIVAAGRMGGLVCARRGRRHRPARRSRGDTAAMCDRSTQSELKDAEVGARGDGWRGRPRGSETRRHGE